MKCVSRLLPLCGLVLLAGCASMADKLQGSIAPPPGTGHVLLSLTAKAFDQDSATAGIRIADPNGTVVASGYASMNTDTVFGEEGMSPVDGRLQLFTLPPGDYEVRDAWGNWTEEMGWTRTWRSASFPINTRFHLEAGQTLYLGEVALDLSFRPSYSLSDQHRRDFGHLSRVWKVKDSARIDIRPLAAPASPAQ